MDSDVDLHPIRGRRGRPMGSLAFPNAPLFNRRKGGHWPSSGCFDPVSPTTPGFVPVLLSCIPIGAEVPLGRTYVDHSHSLG